MTLEELLKINAPKPAFKLDDEIEVTGGEGCDQTCGGGQTCCGVSLEDDEDEEEEEK